MIEFSDYECPYCRQMSPMLDSIAAEHNVQIIYRHFPLASHKMARQAAAAAICADEQGRFNAMHRYLMSSESWKEGGWAEAAAITGVVDVARFEQCLTSNRTATQLEQDITLATTLNVNSTPTFVTKNALRVGALKREQLLEILKEAR